MIPSHRANAENEFKGGGDSNGGELLIGFDGAGNDYTGQGNNAAFVERCKQVNDTNYRIYDCGVSATNNSRIVSQAYGYVKWWRQHHPNSTLKVLGYSCGGDAALRLVRRLAVDEIHVDVLVTYDPHPGNWFVTATHVYEAINRTYVAAATNYYQHNVPHGLTSAENRFWGSPVTNMDNIDQTDVHVDVTNGGGLVVHSNIVSHNTNIWI